MTKIARIFLIAASVFILVGTAFAQDTTVPQLEESPLISPQPKNFGGAFVFPGQTELPKVSEYWIGVQCGMVPPLLKWHLNLGVKEGVLVESVVPDSPAATAGIEPKDILVKIGDATVGSISDIMEQVDLAKETEQTLTVIKKGVSTEIKLTPAKRPESAKMPVAPPMDGMFRSFQPGVIIEGLDESQLGQLPQEIQRMLEESRKQMDQMFSERDLFKPGQPGRIMPRFSNPLANAEQIEISIYPKQDDQAGGLTVKKNDQVWDVSKFADLPEDIQKTVVEVLTPSTNGQEVGQWIAEQIETGRSFQFSIIRQGTVPEKKEETESKKDETIKQS